MAALDVQQNHKPPTRQASLQRMLDLEKKYKLARLHSAQTSPTTDSVTSFPAHSRPPPLQARRRDSKESLAQRKGDMSPTSPRRAVPPLDLSITIPLPDGDKKREDDIVEIPEEHYRARQRQAASDEDEVSDEETEDDDDLTPRERTVTFLADEDDEASSDEEDRKSEQSSICQSPSWENYGEKKKKKKLELEQRKREKERADQEAKARKKHGNRLYKSPPLSPELLPSEERTTSFSLIRPGSSKSLSTQSIRSKVARTGSFVPAYAGIALAAGGYVPGLTPSAALPKSLTAPSSPKLEAAKIVAPQKISLETIPSATQESIRSAKIDEAYKKLAESQITLKALPDKEAATATNGHATAPKVQSSPEDRLNITAPSKSPRTATMPDNGANGVSYPPPSSRTRVLRHTTGNGHFRSNSASGTTVTQIEEASKFFKAQHMKSTQNSKLYQSISEESLQTPAAAEERGRKRSDSSGYVRQTRAQSEERSLSRYMDEVAVSNLPISTKQRPPSAHGRTAPPVSMQNGLANGKTDSEAALKRPVTRGKDREHTDYFNFITKPYAPPSLELTPPAGGGFMSSIKAKLSRRSSSGSTAQRFSTDKPSIPALPVANPPIGDKQMVPRSVPRPTAASSVYSPTQVPDEFTRRLPKAARVLGEYNSITMQSGTGHGTGHPGSRPSEGSSTSSYHDDSSGPPSPASTPDTSRPQSARGLSAAIEEVQKEGNMIFLATAEEQAAAQDSTRSSSSSSTTTQQGNKTADDSQAASKGRLLETDRPRSKGRPLEDLLRPPSKGRSLDDLERPVTRGKGSDSSDRPNSRGRLSQGRKPHASADELGLSHEGWSRTAMPIDFDADTQSFVTSLTHIDGIGSSASLAAVPTKRPSDSSISDRGRPSSRHSKGEDGKDSDRPRSKSSRRRDRKSGAHSKSMSIVNEEPKAGDETLKNGVTPLAQPSPLRPGESSDVSFLPPLRHEALPPKSKARDQASKSTPVIVEPHRTYAKAPFVPSETSSGRSTPSATYLSEARRSATKVPSPLSSGTRPKANSASSAVTATRPGVKSTLSTPAVVASRAPLLPPTKGALSAGSTPQFRIAAQEPEQGTRPVAKMLVECCSCKFFHDMPSRVYECMASPDAVVTDRSLGVSGAITTMVKCPWCSHNMSVQCCAGYAALVYLKERLH